ncbi:DUF5719 family protein [Salinibacterium sp. ZJ450]|uniref:DUF5719 family protein n=1 Tax=Salinibacterium sp. ZJ450 TaxID=2708338 RepID=UPI0014209A38|nr:DUF5719 family protein [Salinibacterium sp. ZJ450]
MSENTELPTDAAAEPSEPANPTDTARTETPQRRRALAGARIVTGVVGVAVAAAAIAGAVMLPIPGIQSSPPVQTITPVSSEQQRVCAGPLLRLGTEMGQDASQPSSLGEPTVQAGGELASAPIGQSDAAGSGPTLLTAPAGTPAAEVSAAQSQSLADGDLGGFAASDCTEPSNDSWLVGGSNAVGRTSILILTNPSELSATVDLSLYGATGPVTAPGTTGLVVPAGSQRVLPLAGFMPAEETPVVRVQSRGGAIAATLQQTTVRGLEAGGVDVVGATAAPDDTVVIPGLVVSGLSALQQNIAREGFADLQNVLRVLVPGDQPATLQVGVMSDAGDPTGASFEVQLSPGIVTDLPIDVQADGSYTLTIDSTVPVVAGMRVSTASDSAFDFAWHAAAPEITGDLQVSVADGAGAQLYLHNPTATAVDVELAALGGEGRVINVAPGASAVVPLSAAGSFGLGDTAGLRAAIGYASDGALASYPVRPPHAAEAPVTVYP